MLTDTLNGTTYTRYAALYDATGQTEFAEQMAHQALHWLQQHGGHAKTLAQWRVLDVACGTGAASLIFARAGCSVVGVDRSEAMLEYARARSRILPGSISVLNQDMRCLGAPLPPRSFDLALCFFDSLNYLLDDDDLRKTCAGVAALLRPGGYFIFDLNSEAGFCAWEEDDQVVYDGASCIVYNRLRYNPQQRRATGRIVWLREQHGRWWRSEETHYERAWSHAEVLQALDAAGLQLLERRTPEGDMVPPDASREVYYTRTLPADGQ